MSAATPTAVAEDEVSLKGFLAMAVLWLPLAFFLWFVLRTLVVFAPIRLATAVLHAWLPDIVTGGHQDVIEMWVTTIAHFEGVPGLPGASAEVPVVVVNALVYCYSLPILVGLVMATPLTWGRTFLQFGVGYLVLLPCQAFGLIGQVLRHFSFDYGSLTATGIAAEGYAEQAQSAGTAAAAWIDAALKSHGLTEGAVGIWYQFGNLILPPISAVIIWILFNRRFIEALTGRTAEPPPAPVV